MTNTDAGFDDECGLGELIGGKDVKETIEDVWNLSKHAIQSGNLPKSIKVDDVLEAQQEFEKNNCVTKLQFENLVAYYQALEAISPTITGRSLTATEPAVPGKIRTSPAGKYLVQLWWFTGLVVLSILAINTTRFVSAVNTPAPGDEPSFLPYFEEVANYLEPFLYGALGAFVYILRVTEEKLRTREFDPARAVEHVNRIILGTLSGGTIILFVSQVTSEDGTVFYIGVAPLGFLAGYSIEFLFETIDRVIKAILPRVGLDTVQLRKRMKSDQQEIIRLQKQLEASDDEEQQKLLKEMIDYLEARRG